MMAAAKIKIHPSFKRLRYANACSKEGKEWISANPEIPWEFSNCDNDKSAGGVKVTHSKENPEAKECYQLTCCSAVALVIFLIVNFANTVQGKSSDIVTEVGLKGFPLVTLFFLLLTLWFLYKDQFYAVLPEEVDDYIAQKREQLQAQKQAAIEKLEKHRRDARIEKIEVK